MERYEVKNFDTYLQRLNKNIENTIMWKKLQEKSEYGSDRSEKGYQKAAILKASRYARNLGLDIDKTELLTKLLGSYFPSQGEEGKKIIREYINQHMDISEPEFIANYIEYDLDSSGHMLAKGLREMIIELYDDSKVSDISEIQLAKLCHEIAETLKHADRESRDNMRQADKQIESEVYDKITSMGIAGYRKELKEKNAKSAQSMPKMTDAEREEYQSSIEKYNKSFIINEGIYNFSSLKTGPSSEKQKG